MHDFFLNLDRHLFYLINHEWGNAVFDVVMPVMRNARFWIPFYVFLIIFIIWRYKKHGAILIVFLALSAGFADYTSASIIKPAVQRLRPCRDPITANTDISRAPCGTGYSFPSTHATDHFAMAVFLSCLFYKYGKWIAPALLIWAAVICYAQVYVGVHFPIDVTIGALYGSLVGWLFSLAFRKTVHGFSV
ncbi:phosphatase PAP2 family protein [Mucilaginibacter litoreus]|uniref:Phosphatase PAP2 family protein n=1 Tax=Mucilaginibacter litoreus TaxID=1048221 RepID=A0ABW3AN88_9SPHI